MITVTGTQDWRAAHPGAVIGLLEIVGVENNGQPSPALDQRKREVEARLQAEYAGFGRKDFLALPIIAAYEKYYRRFDKTYHVLLQVESIVSKERTLPDVSPLVDANFCAEVSTQVLTAGHDVAKLEGSVLMDVSYESDEIQQMNGKTTNLRAGDMVMRDRLGACCSILYGQDSRSRISPETRQVLYVAYAPPGVPAEAVEAHLALIEENVRLFAPNAQVRQNRLLRA